MQAHITNYRGISDAKLIIEKITLVAAPNGGGKSSCCQAIGAALTGEPVPIDGIAKTSAGVLVRSGTAAGKVELSHDAGTTEITWPAAKVKTSGTAPGASRFAVGLESIVTMEPKKRIPFLIEYLKAQPTKQDLHRALSPLSLGWQAEVTTANGKEVVQVETGEPFMVDPDNGPYVPESGLVNKLWELIQTQGWDATYSQVKEKGAKLKGQWEQITNDNYGAKKADTWIPQGYDATLEGASEQTLQAFVTDARDALEAAIAANAVDDSKRRELEDVAGKLLERQALLDQAKKPLPEDPTLKQAATLLEDKKLIRLGMQNALDDLRAKEPKAGQAPTKLQCPCCDKDLMMIAGNKLAEYAVAGPDQATIDAHARQVAEKVKALNAHDKEVEPLQREYEKTSDERAELVRKWDQGIADAARLVRESTQAREELNAMGEPGTPAAGASVEDCRNDLAAHENRLKAFVAKREADRLHTSIMMNQELLKHIAPTGVRAEVLTAAIAEFNAKLADLSGVASWPVTEITSDFGFTFSGTPYFLLSSAEQFRVRTVVQVAMSIRESSGMIIVDGADILDKGGRNGLIKLLHFAGIPSLVGMTIDTEDNVPKLAKVGCGRSYWIGSSVARELA